MKLMVLWDPENPAVPVAPVISALREHVDVVGLTFDVVSHRTLPNGRFDLRPAVERHKPDALLWVEGGPLPRDLDRCGCRKACWLVNADLEPSLLQELGPLFDVRTVAGRELTADESCRWLPLSSSDSALAPAAGIHFAGSDPTPPAHAGAAIAVARASAGIEPPAFPIAVSPGVGGRPHHGVFDRMRSGVVTVVDPASDVRDIGHAGEHLAVYPSVEGLPAFLRNLAADHNRLSRIATRGPDIVRHLHTPALRAEQLRDAIWPRARDLDGRHRTPTVSVLTCCYRFLKRFRVYLDSIARQDLPPGTVEIVVADPGSPDGLADYLPIFAARNPHLRVVHLPLNPIYHRNRGVCINRAFDASSGSTVISTDGDVVFPPDLVGHLASASRARPDAVLGVRRVFVDRDTTAGILDGRRDPVREFRSLAGSPGDGEPEGREGVLGYCQVVGRKAFARARYPEEFDVVNQSDIVFVERLKNYAGVSPLFLQDRAVLHLWHPRDWTGAKESL